MALAEQVRGGAEIAGRIDLVEDRLGQRGAGIDMGGHRQQGRLVEAPVFHELAGKLDGIPLDVVDAGGIGLVDRGQHVLEAVAEFMEEGGDLQKGHQRGFAAFRRRLVADQVGDGDLQVASGQFFPADSPVHPGAAALGGRPAVGIEIEAGDFLAAAIQHIEEADIGMPDRRLAIGGLDRDAKKTAGELEHAVQDLGQLEIGAERLFVVVIEAGSLFFSPIGDIPVHQLVCTAFLAGKATQFGEFLFRAGAAGRQQFGQQAVGGRDRARHLVFQADLGMGRIPQQVGGTALQSQDLHHQRPVVIISKGGTGDERALQSLAQVPAVRIFHEGKVGGDVEGDPPGSGLRRCPGMAGGNGRGRRLAHRRTWQAGDLGAVGQHHLESLGGIQDIVAEPGRQFGQPFLDVVEFLLRRPFQADTGLPGIAQGGGEDAPAGFIKPLPFRTVLHFFHQAVEGRILADFQAEIDDFRAEPVVDIAPFLAVHHAQFMADDSPGVPQRFGGQVQGDEKAIPGRGGAFLQRRHRLPAFRQQCRQGFRSEGRRDDIEARRLRAQPENGIGHDETP